LNIIDIKAQNLDKTTVKPYGKIYDVEGEAPTLSEIDFNFYYNIFDVKFDSEVSFSMVESKVQDEMYSNSLEVHKKTSEILIPLNGTVYILLAKSQEKDSDKPDLTTVKAFCVKPGQGICLPPGIWHRAPLSKDNNVKTVCIIRKGTPEDNITYYLEKSFGLTYRICD